MPNTKLILENIFKNRIVTRPRNPDGILLIGTPEEIISEICNALEKK